MSTLNSYRKSCYNFFYFLRFVQHFLQKYLSSEEQITLNLSSLGDFVPVALLLTTHVKVDI